MFSEKSAQSPELRVHIPSPQHSYSDTSLQSSPCADNTSFTSSCNSDPDQVPPHAEQPAKRKRKRTTFSSIEVWELERAFKQWPYLTSEDEEELVNEAEINFHRSSLGNTRRFNHVLIKKEDRATEQ